MSGKLEKLIITSYKDAAQNEKDQEYTALVNPDQIVLDTKIEYETTSTDGQSGGEKTFKGITSPNLTLKLLFDGTGVLPNPSLSDTAAATVNAVTAALDEGTELSSVNTQIEAFKKVAEFYYGDTHEPRSVQIAWGELLFKGRLETFKVTYTLFNPDGSPLRATGDAMFVGSVDVVTRKKKENNTSPDLTHIRTVHEGDTLPLMCDRIYRNPKLYLEIARVNGLSNYRNLEVGSKLFFPPINDKA